MQDDVADKLYAASPYGQHIIRRDVMISTCITSSPIKEDSMKMVSGFARCRQHLLDAGRQVKKHNHALLASSSPFQSFFHEIEIDESLFDLDDHGDETKSTSSGSIPDSFSLDCKSYQTRGQLSRFRRLPLNIQINESFPRFYTIYDTPNKAPPSKNVRGWHYTKPQNSDDLYSPRWVKGRAENKVGLCPLCKDKEQSFKLKTSAYWYHMNYFHGVHKSGLPYSPPICFRRRTESQDNGEKTYRYISGGAVNSQIRKVFTEGKCHKCNCWIKLEGPREGPVNVQELYWFKHAASCHRGDRLIGDVHFRRR